MADEKNAEDREWQGDPPCTSPSFFLAWRGESAYPSPCSLRNSGQSGRSADDLRDDVHADSAPTRDAVDRVHAWLAHRHEAMRTTFRDLAKEIGLPKSTVQKFYQQKSRPGKIWPKLRYWYVEDRAMRTQRKEAYRPHPHTIIMCAMMTLEDVPLAERPVFMREMAESMKKLHEARRLPCPEWVTQFAEAADAATRDSRIAEIEYWIPEYPRTSLG